MIPGQQLYASVKTAVRVLKGRRRDQAAFFVAALCFSGGFALTRKLVPDFINDKWITGSQVALYAIGALALIYGVVRVWRLVNPPELPTNKDRPSAIKGPMAFTEADGDLFRKLGRESELQKLLGLVLDDQILMIVVRGASGAGKTSLLRAGLKHIVSDDAVFHYWEAVPSEPDKGLLRSIQERWPEGVAKPATLAELINPSDALGRQSHVIVLDQFEQLRGNRKVFELLRRIIRESKPPQRITWVIAFRREFSADWMDFISPEQENGVRPPQDISVRLFTAEQAGEIIAQLIDESDLKDSIEQAVIDNLVEAATVDGEVSPVDIGIGLLVLTELHERQSGQTITKRDYQFAGGAEGLLTQYISRCLEPFPKENQEAILKAMLALRDPEENRQRLATGLTIDELAVEAGTDPRMLRLQLNRLADRDIRLLEAEMPPDGSAMRYRLPHERLIPALYRLTGKLLAEVDQAKLKFQNAFQAWQTNDKRSRYLLKGRELRLVQRYETQIPWGQDEQEKKSFLFRSKRRQLVGAAMKGAVLALSLGSVVTLWEFPRFKHLNFLWNVSGYPPELYDYQHQLKKLEMTEPLNLERFTWLSSDSIEELSLKAASSSNSIAGLTSLAECGSLKKLTLDLSSSQVRDLKPLEQLKGLTQLTLDLRHLEVNNLKNLLEQLKGLTQLSQLTLTLRASEASELESLQGRLKGLPQLKQLTLDFSNSEVTDLKKLLEELRGLTQLSQLTLNLNNSGWRNLQPEQLNNLSQLSQLTQLTLDLRDSGVSNLQPLEQLNGLRQLSLDLSYTAARNLQPFKQLNELTQLSQLRLLTLDLHGREVSDLQPLEKLNGLTQLALEISVRQESDLKSIKQLKGLIQLKLDLRHSAVTNLQPLRQLKGLTQLMVYLRFGQESDLTSLAQLHGLTQLSLDLSGSKVSDLRSLEQLEGLTQLVLDLRNSQVSDLEPIREFTALQRLSVDNATRTQRMSLRKIPASLVELKF